VHTSTITVALLENKEYADIQIPQTELKIETTRGSGNGGQHKNSTDSCVIMTHIPTGIKVVRDGRSQLSNRDDAYKEIRKRVNEFYRSDFLCDESNARRNQIGDGTRSDKRRTYRVKDGIVTDHITNKTAKIKEIMKGKIELLG
jgi:peptide chain release factor 1